MRFPNKLTPKKRSSGWLNKHLRASQSHAVVSSADILVNESTHGTTLHLNRRAGSNGATLRQLRVKEHGNDWMRCVTWNGTTEGTSDIYVARDPELRRTRFDGLSIAFSSDGDAFTATYAYSSPTKRTKTIGAVVEEQVIVPYYKLDFTIISAIRSSEATGVNDPGGNPITLVEVTQRAWAKLEEEGN